MILNESFAIFYLVFYLISKIITKDNWIFNKLENIGNWFKKGSVLNWFFIEVSQCLFCINNWLATICTVPVAIYYFDFKYLMWGILSASISAHFE